MIDRTPLNRALVAMLAAETGQAVGLLVKPVDAVDGRPYHIVFPLDPERHDGPALHDPQADVWLVYQVRTVGALANADQVETAAHRARSAILDRVDGAFAVPLVAAGMRVMDRRWQSGGGVQPGERLASVDERFTIAVTPA